MRCAINSILYLIFVLINSRNHFILQNSTGNFNILASVGQVISNGNSLAIASHETSVTLKKKKRGAKTPPTFQDLFHYLYCSIWNWYNSHCNTNCNGINRFQTYLHTSIVRMFEIRAYKGIFFSSFLSKFDWF